MDESPSNEIEGSEQGKAGSQPAEGVGPAAGPTAEGATSSTQGRPASGSGWDASGWKVRDESARDWVGQLQGMIDGVAEHAGPVLREVAAKAAELAAVAAENAGPALQRAADMTTEVGHKVATRSKEYAAELRRQQAGQGAAEQGTGSPRGGLGRPRRGSPRATSPPPDTIRRRSGECDDPGTPRRPDHPTGRQGPVASAAGPSRLRPPSRSRAPGGPRAPVTIAATWPAPAVST